MINPTAGTAPYSYQWSGGLGIDPIIEDLAAGSYSVTVTDSNGCSEFITIAVDLECPEKDMKSNDTI